MSQSADLLKGARVESCERDGHSLVLTLGSLRLIIHNKWAIRDANGSERDCFEVIGASVRDATTSDTKFVLDLGAVRVEVDLTSNAWVGPEAAVLYVEGRPAVVWS